MDWLRRNLVAMYGSMKNNMLKSWGLGIALGFLLGLISPTLKATYVYEADQDLYDLRNYSGTTNLNVVDDQVSAKFNFGFDFTYYDNTFTFARMATNGCLHFGLNSTSYNDYCGDYTPDPSLNIPIHYFLFGQT